ARAARYSERSETLAEPVPPVADAQPESHALTDAEVQATLGDLLLHAARADDAEEYLSRALKWDATLASAHSSLGLLRLQQNRLSEAREHLARAISVEPENHLAHFYYADVLRREGLDTELTVTGYAATTRLIRAELKRVIELAPNFLEAYALLGLVDVERSPQVDETFALLRRAAALAPKRQEFDLLLAQLHLRLEAFARARQILEPLARDPRSARTRAEAQALLERVAANEALAALQHKAAPSIAPDAGTTSTPAAIGATGTRPEGDAAETTPDAATTPAAETLPCDMPQPGPQFKPLRFDGQQACGQLVSVECEDAGGVTLLVETPEGTLKLRSHALNRIRFVSYTADVRGRVECGLRTRANPVLVTYRLSKDARIADGEVLAVEFVPPDWVH
ncbi:MAG TPA: tetratricopeptide repeat protein, partial [Pyrinomonadaceae bacterium]|nr:tetratricopeptide repeat protein [Pyrinomonadaceae bacterium]